MRKDFLNFGLKHELATYLPPDKALIAFKNKKQIRWFDCDDQIQKYLENNTNLVIGRLGGSEARYLGAIYQLREKKLYGSVVRPLSKVNLNKRRMEVSNGAGFYFTEESEEFKFLDLYIDCLGNVDILGAWGTAFAWIEYIGVQNAKFVVPVTSTAPWVEKYPYHNRNLDLEVLSWASSLDGKKLLVVSPFAKSIESQFKNYSKIFSRKKLPKFEIQTLVAPMTFQGKNSGGLDWFENLIKMQETMSKLNFDIALIGAGAYSFPLANFAKKMGRVGIHAGGGLQLFFGLLGNRWINSDYVKIHTNSFWKYPSVDETPKFHQMVENSSYWKPL
jgi:hypothetical protein